MNKDPPGFGENDKQTGKTDLQVGLPWPEYKEKRP
jgi:hypothetical protein